MKYMQIFVVTLLVWVCGMKVLEMLGAPEEIGTYILAPIALGIWGCFYYFSDKAEAARGLQAAPQKRIGELIEGEFGRISGRIVFGKKVLVAPISGRNCAYYRVKLEEYRNKNQWDELFDIEKFGDIIVFDGSHYALIDVSKIKCHVVPDAEASSGLGHNAPKAFEEFLSSRKMKSTNVLHMNKTLRCEEAVIEESRALSVAGKGYWADATALGLDLPAQRILVVKPGDDGFVFLTSDPDTAESS